MYKFTFIVLLSISSLSAQYKEKVKLPNITFEIPKENIKVMQRNCQWCHSYGYILNQGKQSRKFWNKVVVKMRDVYRAPISDKDEKSATDYLYKNYGNEKLE